MEKPDPDLFDQFIQDPRNQELRLDVVRMCGHLKPDDVGRYLVSSRSFEVELHRILDQHRYFQDARVQAGVFQGLCSYLRYWDWMQHVPFSRLMFNLNKARRTELSTGRGHLLISGDFLANSDLTYVLFEPARIHSPSMGRFGEQPELTCELYALAARVWDLVEKTVVAGMVASTRRSAALK